MKLSFGADSALFERRRPADLDSVVGQDKAKRQLKHLKERRGTLGGRSYWISGKSGMGKTSLARIIAADVADPWGIEEIDAAELKADRIDELRKTLSQRIIGEKGGRALIVNEAHGFRADQVRRLLTLIEPDGGLPRFVVVVFTTTKAGQESLFEDMDDAGPLLSRCTKINLEERGQNQVIAEHLAQVARDEGLGEVEVSKMLRIVNEERGNMRAIYNRLESGEFL